MIIPQGRFVFKTILMTFFLTVTFLYFKENGKTAWKKLLNIFKQPWLSLFFLCTAYILTCTVVGRYFTRPYKCIFGSFGVFGSDGRLNRDMFANVIMFVPYSFLYLKSFLPQQPLKAVLKLSVCSTLCIELAQLIGWMGNFQIADMVHNIIGGLIGYGGWLLWQKIFSGN